MTSLQFSMHPGEVLRTLYMDPLQLTSSELAKALDVPRSRVERILGGKSEISTDTARRLARVFRTSPELWLRMQTAHDLQKEHPAEDIKDIVPIVPAPGTKPD